MKKIICLVLAMFICANNVFAYGNVNYDDFNEYKSKYRILYGALLVIGGGLLAYDGFRNVKVNKSKPSVNMNFSSFWYKSGDNFWNIIETYGDIKNTGNVDLRNVTVWVRYQTLDSGGHVSSHYEPSELGKRITYDGYPEEAALPSLIMGETKNFSNETRYEAGAEGNAKNPPVGQPSTTPTNPEYVYSGQYPSAAPTTLTEIVKVEYDYTKKYKDEMNNVYEGVIGVILMAGGAYLLIDYLVSLKRFDYYMKKNHVDFYVENTADEVKFMFSKKL